MSDPSKILQQAKELSAIMSNSESNSSYNNDNQNSFDMFKLMEMMDFMKTARALSSGNHEEISEDNSPIPRNILALKAMAPHFNGIQGRNMAMAASILELSHIIKGFDKKITAASHDSSPFSERKKMLSAVRKYIDDDKKHILDVAIKAMDLKEAMEKINNFRMN